MTPKLTIATVASNFDVPLFQLLVASVKEYAIFMVDTQGHILTWNEGAARIKGYAENDILGKHISVFYTTDDILNNEPQYNLAQALATGTYESEGWRVRRNGSFFWANVIITPLFRDKQHIGFAKVTRDQTEHKVIEDQREAMHIELERKVKEQTGRILANELRFRKLIENSYDGITLLDRNFQAFYRSPSASRINGWSDEGRADITMNDFIHPDDISKVQGLFAEIKRTPSMPIIASFRSLHHDGNYIWLECLFTNMLADPHVNAIVCNFRDITNRVISENALLQQNIILKEVSWTSSHEVRRPVASILALVDLINQTTDPVEKEEFIKLIGMCAKDLDDMVRLINDKISRHPVLF